VKRGAVFVPQGQAGCLATWRMFGYGWKGRHGHGLNPADPSGMRSAQGASDSLEFRGEGESLVAAQQYDGIGVC
jgi:hypothetical protein